MGHRVLLHVRRQAVAYLALFVALGGTGYAASKLPKNSVGTKQIRNHAVTLSKISKGAQSALHGAGGPAGGDLTGSYPNPTIRAGAVTASKLAPEPTPTAVSPANPNIPCGVAIFCFGGFTPWQNYGHGYAPATFYKDLEGIVHVSGTVNALDYPADTPTPIFYLPVGDRPLYTHAFATQANEQPVLETARGNDELFG